MTLPRPVLLDATTLQVGGGVQVGASLIEAAAEYDGLPWAVACSLPVRDRLPTGIEHRFPVFQVMPGTSLAEKASVGMRLWRLEGQLRPTVVYTIFGPAYWRPRARHVQGFARVMSLYPEVMRETNQTGVRALPRRLLNRLLMERFRATDEVVAETATVKDKFVAKLGFDPDRVYVVPNTYNSTFLEADFTPPAHRAFTFLTPAASYPHKNFARHIMAAAELKSRMALPFRLLFTLPADSEQWRELRRLSETLGVAQEVSTLGPLDRPALLTAYREASAVLFMTLCECSSSVYPEAFVSGRPVVTSDRAFAREVCGEAALFADPLNPAEIAQQMALVATSAAVREELVRNGRRQLSAVYCPPCEREAAQFALLERLYAEELQRRSA